jgi:Asp-tRNA(Asn)/Glu-tRNA(Gln) amidotransferase A subunit family amidase
VFDAAILLQAISGHDPKDSTSVNYPVPDYTQSLVPDLHGMTIGIPREYFAEGLDPQVERAVRKAIDVLEHLGAVCRDVSLPNTAYGVATYYIIAPSEASSNLARYDGVKYGYRAANYADLMEMYTKPEPKDLVPKSFGVLCSAPIRSAPAITTLTISKPRKSEPLYGRTLDGFSRRWTCWRHHYADPSVQNRRTRERSLDHVSH